MHELRPRETVILADNFDALLAWYRDVLGFRVVQQFDTNIHFANLETASGIKIGIGVAAELDVVPTDRSKNTVLLQFEVEDVEGFMASIVEAGGTIDHGPTFNEKDGFWFGAFRDLEGNPIWVVDSKCP